ncbi:toa1p [Saccharomyces arboricola H-6]|uniref:Transcription initiation factor IIA large subunit n=1 Tax=Saccharomyces arboricola (strain H-6 / AS 2.3317 / CBS 10644) TaxID=1160507 RepID=J8LHY9_SACAR|nr:toa1p [Saccharomyces arboricola H-6]
MSNSEASRAYEIIVESVVNEVREDFENAGIDEQTLQDLKNIWQKKLTETKVTTFSWDNQFNEGNINGSVQNDLNFNLATPSINSNEFNIKEENGSTDGLILPNINASNGMLNTGGNTAGTNNNASTNTNANTDVNKNVNTAGESNVEVKPEIELTIENANINTVENVDGEEEKNEGEQKQEEEKSRKEKEQIEQVKLQAKKEKRSALLDTDEVGSELDDSDDDYLISEGEEDGPDENLMLCLYDKVTRTKARWKCSLKDGVVTINRNDYTFQKAQVEAEWV